MWWLIPIAVGSAAAYIYSRVSQEEKTAALRWTQDRALLERKITDHRRNIEQHIAIAQASYSFAVLRDLHHSSFRVADEAYRLMRDADLSLDAMKRVMSEAEEKRAALWREVLGEPRSSTRPALEREIQILSELIAAVRPSFEHTLSERRHFQDELRRFNAQTRALKEAIRDRCGEGGRKWYERLENRVRSRRTRRGG